MTSTVKDTSFTVFVYRHIMEITKEKNALIIADPECFSVKDTLECGQVFRFAQSGGAYVLHASDKYCVITEDNGSITITTDTPDFFYRYFALDTDYPSLNARLRSFPELADAASVGSGIRLLRQDPFEMIISFIVSANNNIPRIKGIINRICEKVGEKLNDGYAFPTRERLLSLSVDDFAALGAGYRAPYLYEASRTVTEDFVAELLGLPTDQARKKLLTVKGVGPKVADCIVLFGLGRGDSFPVDTWINQSLSTKELDTPVKVHDHYLGRYGGLSGLAQQYIFHYARNHGSFVSKNAE